MVSGRGIGLMINLLYGGTPSSTSSLLQGLSVGDIGLDSDQADLGRGDFRRALAPDRRTALGLFLEAVGGNSAAANLAGVDARLVKFAAYLICGVCAAWSGVILAATPYRPREHRSLHRARRDPGRRDRRAARFPGAASIPA